MIPYFLVFAADVLLAVQFVFNKMYQANCGSGLRTCMIFNIFSGVFSAAVFFLISGCTVGFSLYSVIVSVALAVLGGGYVTLGFRIMSEGKVAVYTMFLMLGAMILPYFFGVIFLNERLTVCHVLGAVILAVALVLFAMSENKSEQGSGKHLPVSFWVMCVAVFVLNGLLSILTKIHQVQTAYPTVSAVDFVFWSGVTKAALFSLLLPLAPKPEKPNPAAGGKGKGLWFVFAIAVTGGLSYLFQLYGAADLDASVMFPMLTGGSVVMTALAGRICFREKVNLKSGICIAVIFAATFLFLF